MNVEEHQFYFSLSIIRCCEVRLKNLQQKWILMKFFLVAPFQFFITVTVGYCRLKRRLAISHFERHFRMLLFEEGLR
jgi:hypothetical protein